jgi:hypothetical protein
MRNYLLTVCGCFAMATLLQTKTEAQIKGPSSSQTPYILPVGSGVQTTALLTTQDVVAGYKMCGLADGLGAFDNGDGTFTLLMNHEIGNTSGVME